MKITNMSSEELSQLKEKGRQLYVRDDEYGWLPAAFLERDESLPDRVKVQIGLPRDWVDTTVSSVKDYSLLNKCKRWVAKDDVVVVPSTSRNCELVRDVLCTEVLHEASLLYLLKQRHSKKLYYTRMGSILLSLNPLQDANNSDDLQRSYAKSFVWQAEETGSAGTEFDTEDVPRFLSFTSTSSIYTKTYESLNLEPHLYEVSARAYRGIFLDNVNQSIFVSGLSGSGKTTTYQRLLDHLISLDGLSTDTVIAQGQVHSSMRDRVRASSRLLQAFGSACTPLSSNSTRYGQITQLLYELQSTGLLGFVGSRIDTCLLETSRVTDRTNGTMNFHIFYHMLQLPSKTKEKLLGLRWTETKAGDFVYLRNTELNPSSYDSEKAKEVLQTLETFQCSILEVRDVLLALASVLCLGNLSFVAAREGNVGSAIQGRTDLDRLGSCLGIDGALIENFLTTVTTQASEEVFVTPVSPAVARATRDTLAKTIYSCIFEAITRAINIHTALSLSSEHKYSTITMVDLCGSENLKINRYEQLCVNYANEKMQQKYLSDHRTSLISDYEREGVNVFSGLRIDNSTIVLAFLEGPGGLFETLKDVNGRRDGGTTLFSMKVQSCHNASKNFALLPNENKNSGSEFVIRHFVGPVVYEASNFVERNREQASIEILKFATKSSNALITSECCELIRRQDKDPLEPIDLVRRSADKLALATRGSQAQHVWCIKPNEVQSPSLIDHRVLLRHLQAVDVSTAAKFSEESFANKLPVGKLRERYSCLLSQKQKRNIQQMEPSDRAHYIASNLITRLVEKRPSGEAPFACGTTTVYFKAGVLTVLEQRRRMVRETNALILQDFAFKVSRLRRERTVLRSIKKIQTAFNANRERKLLRRKKVAAIKVQALARGNKERRTFRRLVSALEVLRPPLRRRMQLVRCRRRAAAATRLAAWYRSKRDEIVFHWFRRSVIALQASYRRLIEQRMFNRTRSALSTLSLHFCNVMEHRRRRKASIAIEASWRSHRDRRRYEGARNSAVRIQSSMRRAFAISIFKDRVKAAIRMVGACERFIQRQRCRKLNTSVSKISASYRMVRARRNYHNVRAAVVKIQSLLRCSMARSAFVKKSRSSRIIANLCNGYLRQKRQAHREEREKAATLIAAAYRSKDQTERYRSIRMAIVTIQSLTRMARQRRAFKLDISTSRAAARLLVIWYRSQVFRRQQRAATVIQRKWCSSLMKQSIRRESKAAFIRSKAGSSIGRWYKFYQAQRSFSVAKASATKIQAEWRAKSARDEYLIMKGAALFLEAWVKDCVLPQIQWHRDVAACIIQSRVRGVQARKTFASSACDVFIHHDMAPFTGVHVGDAREFISGEITAAVIPGCVSCIAADDSAPLGSASKTSWARASMSSDDDVERSTRVCTDEDSLVKELSQQVEQYKRTVTSLQSEVEQVTEFASRHTQEMESEFEEKVSLYEDEVLAMQQEIAEAKDENQRLKDAMAAAEAEHAKTMKAIQKGVQKTQSSHRDYLDKIMALLDDTEVARKTETDRIREELEMLKRERDSKIASLKEEIELLRSLGFGAKNGSGCPPGSLTQGARKLAQKLKAALSPDNILLIAKEASSHPGAPGRFVESKLSSQAIKHVSYLEEMIQIADIAATEQAALARAEKQQLQELEVELSRAYQQYGRLQRKGFI